MCSTKTSGVMTTLPVYGIIEMDFLLWNDGFDMAGSFNVSNVRAESRPANDAMPFPYAFIASNMVLVFSMGTSIICCSVVILSNTSRATYGMLPPLIHQIEGNSQQISSFKRISMFEYSPWCNSKRAVFSIGWFPIWWGFLTSQNFSISCQRWTSSCNLSFQFSRLKKWNQNVNYPLFKANAGLIANIYLLLLIMSLPHMWVLRTVIACSHSVTCVTTVIRVPASCTYEMVHSSRIYWMRRIMLDAQRLGISQEREERNGHLRWA